MANNRTIPESDDTHWRRMAGTVTPLRRNRHSPVTARGPLSEPESKPPEADAKPRKTKVGAGAPPPAQPEPAVIRNAPADLDQRGYGGISRADARRIKLGRAPINGTIDLHGMTLHQAGQSLRRFILDSADRGDRTLLVVTGKGRGGMGVIRQQLPGWLRQPPVDNLVLAFCHAQPRDGGSGAYYVRLRG